VGCIRTFLALIVVLTHAYGGTVFIGGQNAVRLFYVISGFLISYVLTEARTYATVRAFYLNRFLRLYPLYALVAATTLLMFFAISHEPFFDAWAILPGLARVLVAAGNVLLVGQDWLYFTAVKHGELVASTNFWTSDVPIYKALLVPQAWTLGVELTFYLVAPWVLLRKPALYLALALSLLVRLYLLRIGLGWNDPWNYRFFPAELCLFLLGALVHQHLLPHYRRLSERTLRRAGPVAVVVVIALCIVFELLPGGVVPRTVALFAVFVLLLPLTFTFQVSSKWDRWVGELSFPIYVAHVLVVVLVTWLLATWHVGGRTALAVWATLGSLGLAYALGRVVARPLERLRNAIRDRDTRSSVPGVAVNATTRPPHPRPRNPGSRTPASRSPAPPQRSS
jgi:peptidoglycan/LPS O-acetylase OafA/YrhL